MSEPRNSENRIALGAIRKPHGVRGEASVEPWTELERFLDLRDVTLAAPDDSSTREMRIEAVRLHAGRALVKFEGLETPEDAGMFRGWTVEVPEEQARKLDSDEYFLHDLVGLTLVDESGNEQGRVVDAYEGGGGVLLEVERGGKTFDVPFATEICRTIDLEGKRIVVALPEGLDEI
jgi:16S rRNA processing protein RimM